MSQLDLRLLHYFTVVAETEHVGRAAARLAISQSPLSRQLRRLEAQLALTLFVREGKRLRLSEAGRRFLPEAQRILKEAKRVARYAVRLSKGESARLSIGFVRNAFWGALLPKALRRFKALYPEVEIELHNRNSAAQLQMLLRKEIDLAFVHWPALSKRIESECVMREPYVLAAPSGHPLLAQQVLQPTDMDALPWIVIERKADPLAHEQLLAACAKVNFRPDIQFETTDLPMCLNLVAAGLGFCLVQRGVTNPHPELIELRVLPWLNLELSVFLARRREHPAQPIGDFCRMLRSNITGRTLSKPHPSKLAKALR